MFTLAIENAKGNRLRLTQNPNYNITSVDGLDPAKANINTAVNANFDGSTFKSSRVENRNIVITLAIEGAVEVNRIELYKFIRTKEQVTIYVTNNTRDTYIKGYVESMTIGIFNKKQMVQISVICPNPYFTNFDEEQKTFSSVRPLFEFPFDIEEEGIPFSEIVIEEDVNVPNHGDIATGMIIEFNALGAVTNPAIYDTGKGIFMKVNVEMAAGDMIQINTKKGQKGVIKVSDGTLTNILNKLDAGSTWLTLDAGDNTMMISATAGIANLHCTVYHDNLYEGM